MHNRGGLAQGWKRVFTLEGWPRAGPPKHDGDPSAHGAPAATARSPGYGGQVSRRPSTPARPSPTAATPPHELAPPTAAATPRHNLGPPTAAVKPQLHPVSGLTRPIPPWRPFSSPSTSVATPWTTRRLKPSHPSGGTRLPRDANRHPAHYRYARPHPSHATVHPQPSTPRKPASGSQPLRPRPRNRGEGQPLRSQPQPPVKGQPSPRSRPLPDSQPSRPQPRSRR